MKKSKEPIVLTRVMYDKFEAIDAGICTECRVCTSGIKPPRGPCSFGCGECAVPFAAAVLLGLVVVEG